MTSNRGWRCATARSRCSDATLSRSVRKLRQRLPRRTGQDHAAADGGAERDAAENTKAHPEGKIALEAIHLLKMGWITPGGKGQLASGSGGQDQLQAGDQQDHGKETLDEGRLKPAAAQP